MAIDLGKVLRSAKNSDKPIIMVGEPVRPSSPWYSHAELFREVIERLGITNTAAIHEMADAATKALAQVKGRRIARVELIVSAKVTYRNGKTVVINP